MVLNAVADLLCEIISLDVVNIFGGVSFAMVALC